MRLAIHASLVVGLGAGLGGLALAACGGGGSGGPDAAPAIDAEPDATPPPPWWQPKPGEARTWDIQLAAPIDTGTLRAAYELELWDLVPAATQLDYGDGDPVDVPAGSLAGTIAALHGTTPPTIVICHVDTGAVELGRPDARKFPGYQASPPDRPTAPAPGSVIGWSTDHADERFLDIREANRDQFAAIIWKRLDLAAQIGCDAVATDHNDMATSDPGFAVGVLEQGTWFREVATQAHARTLSAGMKDANELPGQVDDLAPDFDFLTVQRCGEYQDCDTARPFINLHKAVLAIDYQLDANGGVDPLIACPRQQNAMISDGLVKDVALTSAFRVQCMP
jgi:Glycoside-hydrolase family GH114